MWLQGDADNICLLCHEDKRNGQVQELHCSHRFHKEVRHTGFICMKIEMLSTKMHVSDAMPVTFLPDILETNSFDVSS